PDAPLRDAATGFGCESSALEHGHGIRDSGELGTDVARAREETEQRRKPIEPVAESASKKDTPANPQHSPQLPCTRRSIPDVMEDMREPGDIEHLRSKRKALGARGHVHDTFRRLVARGQGRHAS